MRTLLSRFCNEFHGTLEPVLAPLAATESIVAEAADELELAAPLSMLRDLTHQFGVLLDKVAEQQAYVLIFGPLKSGKSTLMNALSASYVSEVTCLPAYPCMVYVAHSEEKKTVVTRYDGSTEEHTDAEGLRQTIEAAHVDLARRLRQAERDGETFDPALHFPAAIRRVDIKLPAGELAQSGAVMVDTPGLYSRMKFGYDRMTREFRNAAACAIFVVKTDTLFLEQVFEEFNDLLELFSRIFLVVNIDTRKLDVSADGTLVPSLERSEPRRVVHAFEDLAMSEALSSAAAEGRLKIYPVDLLRAASERLAGVAAVDTSETNGANANGDEEDPGSGFEAFQEDLTEYLNSPEYLVAFLGDSLRRGSTLLSEVGELCSGGQFAQIETRLASVEEELDLAGRRLASVETLADHDWDASLEETVGRLFTELSDEERASREETEETAKQSLAAWFKSDASLAALEEEIAELLGAHRRRVVSLFETTLSEGTRTLDAGIRLPQNVLLALGEVGVRLGDLASEARAEAGSVQLNGAIGRTLAAESIPVKKRFWDWVLFRSKGAVRKRVFGDPKAPKKKIPVAIKEAHLASEGRAAMTTKLHESLDRFLPQTSSDARRKLFAAFAERMCTSVAEQVETRRGELEASRAELDTQAKRLRRISNHIVDVEATATRLGEEFEELSERYGSAESESLIEEAEVSIDLEATLLGSEE